MRRGGAREGRRHNHAVRCCCHRRAEAQRDGAAGGTEPAHDGRQRRVRGGIELDRGAFDEAAAAAAPQLAIARTQIDEAAPAGRRRGALAVLLLLLLRAHTRHERGGRQVLQIRQTQPPRQAEVQRHRDRHLRRLGSRGTERGGQPLHLHRKAQQHAMRVLAQRLQRRRGGHRAAGRLGRSVRVDEPPAALRRRLLQPRLRRKQRVRAGRGGCLRRRTCQAGRRCISEIAEHSRMDEVRVERAGADAAVLGCLLHHPTVMGHVREREHRAQQGVDLRRRARVELLLADDPGLEGREAQRAPAARMWAQHNVHPRRALRT